MLDTKLKIRQFALKDLNPAEYNPRQISAEAYKGLAHSLARFGCVEPIVVNVRGGRNTIIGGHQRHKVLLEMHGGAYKCPCVTVDLKEADEKLLNISLNNPEIQGEFTADLQKQIDELQAECEGTTAMLDLRIEELRTEAITQAEKCQENCLPDMLGYLTFVVSDEQRSEIEHVLDTQDGENRTEQLLCLIRRQ